jgi:hypothetical protein
VEDDDRKEQGDVRTEAHEYAIFDPQSRTFHLGDEQWGPDIVRALVYPTQQLASYDLDHFELSEGESDLRPLLLVQLGDLHRRYPVKKVPDR